MGTGAFMTDAFDLGDDVGEYTFLFREVKINHAGGYQKVYGGVWSAAATAVNAVTEVDAYNEADVLSGGETEFKGLFQVKLDKEYWPSTEAKDNNRVGELKPLAGVTFELLLARENANGLLEAVTGRGAFSTEFVTGCESGMSAGYGVSITVSLETLYTENGGADNPDNPVKLGEDENGHPFYEADFILREKDYPINMVYMQERYALHVKAVRNAQGADYVTVVDDLSEQRSGTAQRHQEHPRRDDLSDGRQVCGRRALLRRRGEHGCGLHHHGCKRRGVYPCHAEQREPFTRRRCSCRARRRSRLKRQPRR